MFSFRSYEIFLNKSIIKAKFVNEYMLSVNSFSSQNTRIHVEYNYQG